VSSLRVFSVCCAEQMLTQAPLAYSSGGSLSVASVANAVFDSASADAVDELLNKALYLFTPKQLQKALALVDQASSLSVFACVSSAHGCVRQGGVTCVVAEASRRTLCQVSCAAPLLRRSPPHARSGQRPQAWRGLHLLPWPFLQLPRLPIRRRLQGWSTQRAFSRERLATTDCAAQCKHMLAAQFARALERSRVVVVADVELATLLEMGLAE